MKVFLVGASGFIGQRILHMLWREGHEVIACVRNPSLRERHDGRVTWVQGDFSTDQHPAIWKERLQGCDVVINAVGIIRETRDQHFEDLHHRGPVALFSAAASCEIRKVLQISALGADAGATTRYHLTKRAADEHLASLGLDHVILHPSIVMGKEAESSRLFSALSLLPVLGLPGGGRQRLQPVSVDDLVDGIRGLMHRWPTGGRRYDVVGEASFTFAEIIAWMRPPGWRAPTFAVPMPLIRLLSRLRLGLLDPEAISMMERGNCGDSLPFAEASGVPMRSMHVFWSPGEGRGAGTLFLLGTLFPVMRLAIAGLWIWTGIVSAFLFPAVKSYLWLRQAGVPSSLFDVALYGASALDAVLGLLIFTPFRRGAYLAQFILVLVYTVVVTAGLPDMWLHPFGPVSKNAPLLAATLIAALLDGPSVSRRR